MGRVILSVIVGYIAMTIVVFGGLTAAYLAMGSDRAFRPGVYDVTATWLVVMFAVSLVAAIAGGFVCALIAQRARASRGLAILVLVLGGLSAIPAFIAEDPGPRTGDLDNLSAMQEAKQPIWTAIVLPIVGAVGVVVGGRLRGNATGGSPPGR
jgi:hypothetical protein